MPIVVDDLPGERGTGGSPSTGVCTPWATEADICSPCDDYAFDAALLDDMLDGASDILYALSGRQFPGECRDVVRPCARSLRDDTGWSRRNERRIGSTLGGGWWGGACGCQRGGACGCTRLSEISLGAFPVTGIVAIKVDGAALEASRYRIDEFRWLVRLPDADGSRPGWPCCQRLDLPSTEPDTFEVNLTYGVAPPPGGVRAAAALACEFALLCQPETVGSCRLSPRVTQLDRQGLSMVISNPEDYFPDGRTGLPEVDLWIRAVNPHGIAREATVLSPDIGRRVRRVRT